jgi:hypothetical protein
MITGGDMQDTNNKIRVELRPATKENPVFQVLVFELKFDTIRQSEGWVLKKFKTYSSWRDAETFAKRFGWKG